jgi:hypothetical protein
MERKFDYLINNRVIWRRDPITDIPDIETDQYLFYKDGTYQCYNLFRSKAKITTYRSLKWHMLVLWHLNPDWDEHNIINIAMYIANKDNGFITFTINRWNVARLVNDLSVVDLEHPPTNKLRKIIFKWNCGLTKSEKLSIVGQLIGRMNGVKGSDIYEAMLYKNHCSEKITIKWLSELLKVTPRTIYRHMNDELKQEKERLNEII